MWLLNTFLYLLLVFAPDLCQKFLDSGAPMWKCVQCTPQQIQAGPPALPGGK